MVNPDALGQALVNLIAGIPELQPALPGGVGFYGDTEAWVGKAAYAIQVGSALVAYIGTERVQEGGAALQHVFAVYVRPLGMTCGTFLYRLIVGKPQATNGVAFANYFFPHGEHLEMQSGSRNLDDDGEEFFEVRITINDRNWV